jgi:ubiquinone/menaquinone biosynthesis C-methylase UbiE
VTIAAAFDRGASRYDLLVGLNPGYHRELRVAAEALMDRVGHRTGLRLIDLACGTGASTRALHRAAPDGTEVLGLDASHGMLDQARRATWPASVRFCQAVAGELDVEGLGSGTHHGIMTAYLFRNVPVDVRDKAVAEVYELLAPGGWLVIQEYSVAGDARARHVWDAVSRSIIIPLGVLLDGNHDLYHYLWQSVVEFDSVTQFADRLVAGGFVDVAHRTATGWQHGILHTFVARKPREKS